MWDNQKWGKKATCYVQSNIHYCTISSGVKTLPNPYVQKCRNFVKILQCDKIIVLLIAVLDTFYPKDIYCSEFHLLLFQFFYVRTKIFVISCIFGCTDLGVWSTTRRVLPDYLQLGLLVISSLLVSFQTIHHVLVSHS